MLFMRLKITSQLVILVSGTALLTVVVLVILSIISVRSAVEDESQQRLGALAEATGELLAQPMASGNHDVIGRTLQAVVRDEAFERATLFEPSGAVVAQRALEEEAEYKVADDFEFARTALADSQIHSQIAEEHEDLAVPIKADGRVVGVLLAEAHSAGVLDELSVAIPQMILYGAIVALGAALIAVLLARLIAAPIQRLATAAAAIGRGEQMQPPLVGAGGEIGVLSAAFDQMVTNLQQTQAQVADQRHMLEQRVAERTKELEQTLDELRESIVQRDLLTATVRDLASPVVPVLDGILVMPLVGSIDTHRADAVMESMLKAIEKHHAKLIILDVTGVPIVDTQVARALIASASAARLLGAEAVLVGLRPELAQTIVGLGLDLNAFVTRADLQSGVSYALAQKARLSSAAI